MFAYGVHILVVSKIYLITLLKEICILSYIDIGGSYVFRINLVDATLTFLNYV